jgi:cobalt-zinc-cadmium efflux system outer membrane protein
MPFFFFSFPRLRPSPARALVSALIFSAAEAFAQEAVPARVTLGQALALAAERHPGLMAQAYQERSAAGLVEQAGYRPNPTVEVGVENVLGTGRVQGVRSLEATVQASQTFERGGKREKRVAVASREREAVAREFAVRRGELLAATATAYINALAARQRLTLAAEPLRLARETLAHIDARVRSGTASSIESARARAAVISSESEFARTEAAWTAARAALAATWGGELAEVGDVAGALHVPATLPAEAEFRARLANHPRLEWQAAIVAGRRAALTLEQAQATGDVTASGGVRFLREGTDAGLVAGLSVPLPVRHKNQGSIRAARETLAGAEQSVRVVELELRTAFTAAWQDLAAAHTLAQKLRREALPAAEEAHTAVRQAYEAGQLPLIDVLEAQRTLAALRREILDAETAYALALSRVESLTAPTFPATLALLSSE